MGKRTLFFGGLSSGVLVIVLALAVIAFPVESAIPPTPAWDQIRVKYDTWNPTQDDNINASSYTDNLTFISDGSIIFNFTTYP